jgi:hypothetical protein
MLESAEMRVETAFIFIHKDDNDVLIKFIIYIMGAVYTIIIRKKKTKYILQYQHLFISH